MKKYISYTFIFLLLFIFVAGTALAKKWSKRKMSGQYTFNAGSLFAGTAILAKDKGLTKLPDTPDAHSVVGKWKLKRHKQLITIDWPDQAQFVGYVVDRDTITGVYTDVNANIASCVLNRITNSTLFHVHIYRTGNKRVKGAVFYNFASKDVTKRNYRIAVYARYTNDVARIVKTPERKTKSRVPKLGFFKREIGKGFDIIECFLISKDFDPPDESTNTPALTIDGTNVFAYDWQYPGFKWFDWSVTNYY